MNIPEHIGSQYISLVPGIRLRREYFGGLVYDPHNGTTLEVDKEAFHFLFMIKDRAASIDELVRMLTKNKALKMNERPISAFINQLRMSRNPKQGCLNAIYGVVT